MATSRRSKKCGRCPWTSSKGAPTLKDYGLRSSELSFIYSSMNSDPDGDPLCIAEMNNPNPKKCSVQ